MPAPRLFLVLFAFLSLVGSSIRAAEKAAPRTDRHGDALPEGALARLGSGRLRVGEGVKALAFWPDDQTLAACCSDGSVHLWERASGRKKCRLHTGSSSAFCAVFLPTAGRVALVTDEEEIIMWDLAARKAVWKEKPAQNAQKALLAVSADGKLLAVRTGDTKVEIYDAASGRTLHPLEGVTDAGYTLAFSPDGSLLALAQGKSSVGLWDVRTGKKLRSLACPESGSSEVAIAFAPDGKTVAVGSSLQVVLSRTATGKEVARCKVSGDARAVTPRGLLFSADGKTLISAHTDALRFWGPDTGKELRRLQTSEDQSYWLALARDGKALATARWDYDAPVLRLLDPATGKDLLPAPEGHQLEVHFIAFSSDGRTVLSGDSKSVRSWEGATGKPGRSIHATFAADCALSMDRTLLADPGSDWGSDEIKLWDLTTGKVLRVIKYKGSDLIRPVAFFPDGKQLLSAHNRSCGNGTTKTDGQDGLHFWDVSTGKEVGSISATTPEWSLYSGLVVPDGRTAIVGSRFGFVGRRPQGVTGGASSGAGGPLRVWDLRSERVVRTLDGHQGAIRSLELSADGRLLLSADAKSACLLWELASWQTLHRLHGTESTEQTAALSPDGRLVASSSGLNPFTQQTDDPFTICVCSTISGQSVLSLLGHTSVVRCLAFSSDGRRLVSGCRDGTALIWDVAPAQQAVEREIQQLAAKQTEALWADLANTDAVKARQAVWALVNKRDAAVRLLKAHLKPVEGVESERLRRLVAELDSDDFAIREAAMRQLQRLGELAESALRAAQKEGPALELQRRLGLLLAPLSRRELSLAQLRAVRAIEVLERIGSAEARQLLDRLAAGTADARLSREAKAALDRLGRHPAP